MKKFHDHLPLITATLGGLFLWACSPTETSELDHTFGVTSRVRKQPLTACEKLPGSDPKLVYLQSILDSLTSANAGTFKDGLAPSRFCLRLLESSEVNASADVNSGIIQMYTETIRVSQYDADIAAVLAHELAHISMDHGYSLEHDKVVQNSNLNALKAQLASTELEIEASKASHFPEIRNLIKQDPGLLQTLKGLGSYGALEYSISLIEVTLKLANPTQEEKAQVFLQLQILEEELALYPQDKAIMDKNQGWKLALALLEKGENELFNLETKRSSLVKQIRDIPRDDLIGDGAGAAKNWREQEADEVGFELYLRAGYKPERYVTIHKILLSRKETEKECNALLDAGDIPARGSQSHPSSCWRIYNINNREQTLHKKEYEPFLKNSQLNIKNGELEKVKAAL